MVLSKKVKMIRKSGTLKTLEKARELEKKGVKVIYLSVGEPDFDTPQHIKEAAWEAIKSGYTHYTLSQGILELREAIAEKLQNENNIDVTAENVIVTPGAKQAIMEAILALVDEGDEVLIPTPAWVSYEEMVKIAGGVAKRVPTDEHFKLAPEALEESIGEKTKLLILNSPNNPTGAVYSERELRRLSEILIDKNVYVISDEIYEKIVYDGKKHFSIGSIPGMEELTVTVNGFSKAYAMTGWRLGYAAGPRKIISAMNKIQQHSVTCVTAFVQKAGVEALKSPLSQRCVEEMVTEFERRRNLMVSELSKISSLDIKKPQGTFYIFPDISGTGMSSAEYAEYLLEEEGVAVTPGSAFADYDTHIRISFANSVENLMEAVERIKRSNEKLLEKLK